MKIRYVVTIDPEASRDAELEAFSSDTNPLYGKPAKPAPDEFIFDSWGEVIDHLEALEIKDHADYGILISCRMNPTGCELPAPRPAGPSMAPRPSGQPARQ